MTELVEGITVETISDQYENARQYAESRYEAARRSGDVCTMRYERRWLQELPRRTVIGRDAVTGTTVIGPSVAHVLSMLSGNRLDRHVSPCHILAV